MAAEWAIWWKEGIRACWMTVMKTTAKDSKRDNVVDNISQYNIVDGSE